ncbi:hypothetical protein IFM89_011642 [Coptis chinensis]|uniref:Uncharacterized protein n=1 Tax=Coptis chinensis TaxID=261450 RepID=A0A835GYI5_9MAGN|nr:hypothetical protein IFM89_011642 [Coptis chinensis]
MLNFLLKLFQVYVMLCSALVASAVVVYLHLLMNIGGLLTIIRCMGSMIWLLSTPPYEEKKRLSLMTTTGLLEGASIGPLINLVIKVDPRCV